VRHLDLSHEPIGDPRVKIFSLESDVSSHDGGFDNKPETIDSDRKCSD